MKQKKSDITAYLLLSVIGIVLVGIIIYYIKDYVDTTKRTAGHIIEESEELGNEYIDYDITMYDGENVRGSEVINFIKKNLGDYGTAETAPVYVQVQTVNAGTSYTNKYQNKAHINDNKNFSSASYYIKPTALFLCEVIKSANNAILGVNFKQK